MKMFLLAPWIKAVPSVKEISDLVSTVSLSTDELFTCLSLNSFQNMLVPVTEIRNFFLLYSMKKVDRN